MQEFSAGTAVTLTVQHSNNGSALTLTDLKYQVLDAYGEELVALVSVPGFNPAVTSTNITIDSATNSTTEKVDVRQVNLQLITSGGTYNQTIYYKIIGDVTKLTPMVDSFMTFPESIIVRAKMSENLKYFDALTDDLKAVALQNSFEKIVKIRYKFNTTSSSTVGTDISTMTAEQFKALPAAFQEALKKAQLAQSDALVESSPVRDKIRDGIISETIGESSMFFRQTDIISTNGKFPGVADASYEYLKDWVWKSATSAQIWRIGRA